MKPKSEWSFSAPLADVNVRRILREAGVASGAIARFTINGKTYTAWDEFAYPDVEDPQGSGYWYSDDNEVFRAESGEVRIRVVDPSALGFYDYRLRIQNGDHVKALLDRVDTKVEVF